MNTEWIEFNDDHHYSDKENPRVTLDAKRHFRLNSKALDLLGRPDAIRFLFDAGRNRIGIRPDSPENRRAFRLVPSKTGATCFIRAFAFCNRFGIKPEFNVAFQGVHLDGDGTLILDLTTAKRKAAR